MSLVAVLTAMISVNGAVAALLPVVVVMAVRLKRKSSQLLMPLVFSAHAGSMLALTGTPVNVLVSEAGFEAGVGEFGFFEFALVGIPLLAGTMAIIILFGERLLPQRNGAKMPADLSRHAKTLVEQYGLADGIFQMRVRATSPYVGLSPSRIDLSAFPGLQLVAMQDGESAAPLRRPVEDGDHMLVRGTAEAAASLAARMHLSFREDTASDQGEETLFNRRSGLAEVVIPPRSGLIGQTMFPGMVTDSGDLIVLAVQRAGAEADAGNPNSGRGGIALRAGDTMLLQGTWKALDLHLNDPDVLVVNSPELVRRQAVPLGPGAYQAIAVLAGMVILLATGLVPPAVAGLLAAGAIVLSPDPDRRAILSRHRLDDGDPRRRADAAVDRDGGDRGRPAHGRRPGRPHWRRRTLCAARRPFRAHRHHGPVDQQYRDGADRHSHRSGGRDEHGCLAPSRPHEHRGGGGRRFPDPHRDPDEPDGHGAGRLCV